MNVILVKERKQVSLKSTHRIRAWATPLTLGAFALSAITGILLFFKINLGLVKPVHEWLSWLLVIGTAFHLFVNWRPSVQYLTRPVGKGILAVFFLLICASLLPLTEGKRKPPFNTITDALLNSPISTVAQVANHTPDETLEILRSSGISAAGQEQTIREIAKVNNKQAMDVLTVIF